MSFLLPNSREKRDKATQKQRILVEVFAILVVREAGFPSPPSLLMRFLSIILPTAKSFVNGERSSQSVLQGNSDHRNRPITNMIITTMTAGTASSAMTTSTTTRKKTTNRQRRRRRLSSSSSLLVGGVQLLVVLVLLFLGTAFPTAAAQDQGEAEEATDIAELENLVENHPKYRKCPDASKVVQGEYSVEEEQKNVRDTSFVVDSKSQPTYLTVASKLTQTTFFVVYVHHSSCGLFWVLSLHCMPCLVALALVVMFSGMILIISSYLVFDGRVYCTTLKTNARRRVHCSFEEGCQGY